MTSFEHKCNILSKLWTTYKFDTAFSDFVEYNDLGLPLAFAISEELVRPTVKSKGLIEETFNILLGLLELEDEGFETLEDMLG